MIKIVHILLSFGSNIYFQIFFLILPALNSHALLMATNDSGHQKDLKRISAETLNAYNSPTRINKIPYSPKAKRLNILFLAVDDLRPELGAYGSKVKTPNIDRLASYGTLFHRAYCQQAVCGASRVSLMTGLYPTLTKEQTFHVKDWRKRHPSVITINQHFIEQGYNTIGIGKIYHGTAAKGSDPTHWNQWVHVDSGGNYLKKENIDTLQRAIQEGKIGDQYDPPKGPMTESANVSDDAYIDGKYANKAVELLEQLSTRPKQPFFLAVGMLKPHLPFVAPQKYWDLYDRKDFIMPSNKAIPPGYPHHAANLNALEMKKYSDFEGNGPKDFSMEMNKKLLHGYAAATSYVDACIGKILDALDQNGLSENTIVVLLGDHGWKLGDHSSWCKHTNFECDTRVPLILHDPRLEAGSTSRLVELIDLFPTLCELTETPTPRHCQGRSFRALLENPQAGHRLDAYSSYPAHMSTGHSIRFKNYRYTDWLDDDGNSVASVLTDLSIDPGEEANVKDDPKYLKALKSVKERLKLRIQEAMESSYDPNQRKANSPSPEITPNNNDLKQSIDGFGGSVAFWGTNPDDQTMNFAFKELKVSILRAQGEISPHGKADHNKEVLQRAMKLNPELQILLTFWQPRSLELLNKSDWLKIVDSHQGKQYELKYSMEDAWADEIVRRTQKYLSWGINVTTIGVQNETNYSKVGSQTCIWDPVRLKSFIENRLKPRLDKVGLKLKIAAPDLAYVGYKGSEVARFLPTIQSNAVDIVAYHMYDSYKDGMDGSISILRENSQEIGNIRNKEFPNKGFWMTETTGAQWNSDVWHTYGWNEGVSEFDKAILAAQYAHMSLADAGANVFMWWGLIYSLAPEKQTNSRVKEKHRDEGLVLVQEKPDKSGRQRFVEKTKKFYILKQFANFLTPGFRRVSVNSPDPLLVSAYLNDVKNKGVIILINSSDQKVDFKVNYPSTVTNKKAFQTGRRLNCQPVKADNSLPSKSIRTIEYSY